jgi:hypothetical protein
MQIFEISILLHSQENFTDFTLVFPPGLQDRTIMIIVYITKRFRKVKKNISNIIELSVVNDKALVVKEDNVIHNSKNFTVLQVRQAHGVKCMD